MFFNGYASEPKGALSWRFQKEFAGSGAMGDLLCHVVDLVQYVVGPIDEVTALLSTHPRRTPDPAHGSGTHFAVIEDGELGDVENDDYAAALVRFAADSRGAGAVGTLECSRVVVGPQCGLSIEMYGTEGSAIWNFERMNELKLAIGRGGRERRLHHHPGQPRAWATTRSSSPARATAWATTTSRSSKPGSSWSVTGGERATAPSTTPSPPPRSCPRRRSLGRDGPWVKVPAVHGATYGGEPAGAGR